MTDHPPSSQDLAAEGLLALERGDLPAAADAIGRGLWLEPGSPTLLRLAERLQQAAPDPDTLVPLRVGMPAHAGALRARYLAARGALTEALSILVQIAAVDPHVPYLRWARLWLTQDPQAPAAVQVGPLLSAVAGVQDALEGQREQWGLIADMLAQLRAAHAGHPHLPAIHALAMRNAGRHAEAIAIARAAYDAEPGFAAAVALAGTYRGAGQLEEALEAYRRAEQHAPGEPGPALDRGDLLETAGRHAEALAEYEAVLAAHPDHPWAQASAHYVRHRLGDRSARYALWDTWITTPDNARARQLARRIAPFVGYLPPPWEALVQYARDLTPATLDALRRQALASVPPGAEIKEIRHLLHLERPEPPSAQQIARRVAATADLVLAFEVEGLPEPDPRRPLARNLRWLLWRYDGDTALPGLTIPEDAGSLVEAVRQIAARETVDLDYAVRAGQWMGEHLGEDDIPALLAVALAPPEPPEDVALWDWVPRVQRVCATAVAFLGETWAPGAPRYEALRALILGPSDWTVVAGAWAAVALADADGTGAVDTATWILERLRAEPIDIFSGPTYGLALALLFHPAASMQLRRAMRDLVQEAETHLVPADGGA